MTQTFFRKVEILPHAVGRSGDEDLLCAWPPAGLFAHLAAYLNEDFWDVPADARVEMVNPRKKYPPSTPVRG